MPHDTSPALDTVAVPIFQQARTPAPALSTQQNPLSMPSRQRTAKSFRRLISFARLPWLVAGRSRISNHWASMVATTKIKFSNVARHGKTRAFDLSGTGVCPSGFSGCIFCIFCMRLVSAPFLLLVSSRLLSVIFFKIN